MKASRVVWCTAHELVGVVGFHGGGHAGGRLLGMALCITQSPGFVPCTDVVNCAMARLWCWCGQVWPLTQNLNGLYLAGTRPSLPPHPPDCSCYAAHSVRPVCADYTAPGACPVRETMRSSLTCVRA